MECGIDKLICKPSNSRKYNALDVYHYKKRTLSQRGTAQSGIIGWPCPYNHFYV